MLLSIIVPIHNTEKHLNKCIDSILNQTFRDFELILVNDGSTDSSGKICDDYGKNFKNVKVVHQENKGVVFARKAGVEVSAGEYVAFVDSDDRIDEDMYKILMNKITNTKADIAMCNMLAETENGAFWLKNKFESGFYDKERLKDIVYPGFIFDFSTCGPTLIPSLCNKVIKKDIINFVTAEVASNVSFGEDAIWSFSALAKATSVFLTDEFLYHYRYKNNFTANEYDEKALEKIIVLRREMKAQLDKTGLNYGKQVDGYITRYVIECVRGELLYRNDVARKKKYRDLKMKLSDPAIQRSLENSIPLIKCKKLKLKLFFILKGWILFLHIPFYFNLKIRRKKD